MAGRGDVFFFQNERTNSERQAKSTAHTGIPAPNMSRTFIGRSSPLLL